MTETVGSGSHCSVARGIDVLGESWTLLIVREAMISGTTRFRDFRDALGIAPNILSRRLAALVEEGILERRSYQEAGARARDEYVLTESGRSLALIIGALSEWGRRYRPHDGGTSPRFQLDETDVPAHLAFVTPDGEEVSPDRLVARRTADR